MFSVLGLFVVQVFFVRRSTLEGPEGYVKGFIESSLTIVNLGIDK